MPLKPVYINFCLLLFLYALSSCSPRVITHLEKSYKPLPAESEVKIYHIGEEKPLNSEVIGKIRIEDSGNSINCGYDEVLSIARQEALMAGGDALWIYNHIRPNLWGSSCHQIAALILKLNKSGPEEEEIEDQEAIDTSPKVDYITLHIYRKSRQGRLLKYNLYLNDSLIRRVSTPYKTTIRIYKEGEYTLWAEAEKKSALRLNLKKGDVYYINCGVSIGFWATTPYLSIRSKEIGATEFREIDNMYEVKEMTPEECAAAKVNNFRIVFNGGYSYLTGAVDKNMATPLKDYVRDIKSGYHYGGDVLFYFRETFGLGVKFDRFRSSHHLDNISLTDSIGNVRYGRMSDDIYATFYGLTISSRYRNVFQSDQLYINASIGYMDFLNKFELIDPYTMSGGNLATVIDLGYDFEISKDLYFGFQTSYFTGSLGSVVISDSQSSTTYIMEEGEYINFSRLNISAGLRLILK